MLRAWRASDNIDFNFPDSHLKTAQVRDTSSEATLKDRLRERMRNSKNMLVIISEDTNFDRGLLNWEIKTAMEDYNLPVIVAYAGRNSLYNLDDELIRRLPKEIFVNVVMGFKNFAHIPFAQDDIYRAINHYSAVNGVYPQSPKEIY